MALEEEEQVEEEQEQEEQVEVEEEVQHPTHLLVLHPHIFLHLLPVHRLSSAGWLVDQVGTLLGRLVEQDQVRRHLQ